MVFVARVRQRFFQIGIAPGSATVLRRAGALSAEASGHLYSRLGIESLLENDVVLPAVAEVIVVVDPVSGLLEELRKPSVALISVSQFGIGDSVVARPCREDVEVRVGYGAADQQPFRLETCEMSVETNRAAGGRSGRCPSSQRRSG